MNRFLYASLLMAFVLCVTGCSTTGIFVKHSDPVTIHSETMGGKQAFVLENSVYRAVLVPEIARFPVSLINKSTGHDFFAQLEPLDAPNDMFRYYGGIVDSLPWVSGTRNGQPLQSKGLLYSVPWQCTVGADAKSVWFEGTAEIVFQGPLEDATNRLQYVKRVTGKAGSADIRLDQRIRNIGDTPARFTMTLHARTAIAGYDEGDYLFVPGKRAYISYMQQPVLAARGITPPQWVDWPFPEAVEFKPGAEARNVFVFLPADWSVAGDDKTGEALVFRGGEVSTPGEKRKFRTGLFMTNKGYVVEPNITSCIEATPETWADPENTIRLEPGESCEFSMTLTLKSNVHRADW